MWGRLNVNLIGALIIGCLWGLSEQIVFAHNTRLFLFIGILGSFTTFSAFTLENFNLLRDGEYWLAALNIALSVLLGIVLVFAGHFIARSFAGAFNRARL